MIKRGGNPYSRGDAPKCPAIPANLKAWDKPSPKPGEGNICDAKSDKMDFSPWDMDISCTLQSVCYDNCGTSSWEECNAIFAVSMAAECAVAMSGGWVDALVSPSRHIC